MYVKVEDLKIGDRVDLTTCPYLHNDPSAPFEWAIVDDVIKERENCILVIYESLDEVGYPVGTELRIRD